MKPILRRGSKKGKGRKLWSACVSPVGSFFCYTLPRMPRVLSSSFVRSLFFVIGGSIGAGMFGLPALFAQSGRLWGSVLYWAVVGVVLLIHMAYAELQAKAGSKHDLAGIAKRSLGKRGWVIAMVVYPISVYGAVLVYLLLGAQFLAALSHMLGGPTSPFIWQTLLWIFFAWGAHKGVKGVAKFERPITVFLVLGLLSATIAAALSGKVPVFLEGPPSFSVAAFIGVVFFSAITLPLIAEVMAFDGRKSIIGRHSLVIGTLAAALLKWLFALSFMGVAIGGRIEVMGLMQALPVGLRWLLPLVGFLAISGSAVSVLDSLRIVYRDEFSFRPSSAWLLAVLPPLALVQVSQGALLPLMTFLGSFVAATNALLVCIVALVERTRLIGRLPRVMMYLAIGLCLFTIAHTFIL